jgi:putative copper export protein
MAVQHSELASAVTATRVSIHVLAATVWVGGQLSIAGLLKTVRSLGPDAPKKIARAFAKIEWPIFFILIATGIWNAIADNPSTATSAWRYVMTAEVLVALLAGLTAWMHQRAKTKKGLAIFGALSGMLSITAVILGVLLAG